MVAAGAIGANVEDSDPAGPRGLFEPAIGADRGRLENVAILRDGDRGSAPLRRGDAPVLECDLVR